MDIASALYFLGGFLFSLLGIWSVVVQLSFIVYGLINLFTRHRFIYLRVRRDAYKAIKQSAEIYGISKEKYVTSIINDKFIDAAKANARKEYYDWRDHQ